jgi:hypothetical protein
VLRGVQVPLLAVLLIGAGAAKARRMLAARSVRAGSGPTAIFPVGLQGPAAAGLCAAELVLGLGLLITAGSAGAGTPALVFRVSTVLLFGTAVGALYVLGARRPDAGCGCFGELSETPVSWPVITRAAVLGAAALATAGAPPLHRPNSAGQAGLTLAAVAAELALLTLLSPEVGRLMVRLSRVDPCELQAVPITRTLAALYGSTSWRRHRHYVTDGTPVDIWREGCWRFVAFSGLLAGRRVEVVFAVYLAGRHPPVRVGMLDVAAELSTGRRSPTGPLQLSNQL